MNKNKYSSLKNSKIKSPILSQKKNIFFFLFLIISFQLVSIESSAQKISYCDTSLKDSQKYVLKVDEKPFYMTNVQVRLDKMRYWWDWNTDAREAIIKRAADDGFNTISIPIHWYEIEPKKNNFDWTILDEYLGLANKYNIKVELLWFGQNSGGHVQWLGEPSKINNNHLRTPDYVLYSPSPKSEETTSEYTILRKFSNYTLDLKDDKLRDREVYVVGQMMDHVASWDALHGSKHTLIGIQINNEVKGADFSPALIISYMNSVAGAIKKSKYVVWTRMNCVWGDQSSRIETNEALRLASGSNIDFIGIDLYTNSPATIQTVLPFNGKNYRMIMECGAEVSNAAQLQLAALSGNNAYAHYEMCGPDNHGLYRRDAASSFLPNGYQINNVRIVNKIINSANVDIATNAQGYGLYVHNWAGKSSETTMGLDSISFTPATSSSQAISISRSNTEIILMSTNGGSFTYPSSLGITGASVGYFDQNNKWVNQGNVPFTNTSITPAKGTTVLLSHTGVESPKVIKMQAEFANFSGGKTESDIFAFAGNGYISLSPNNSFIEWTNVNGLTGGDRTVGFRYSSGSKTPQNVRLIINGKSQTVSIPSTNGLEIFKTVSFKVPMNSGTVNTIRLETIGQDPGYIDELQVY